MTSEDLLKKIGEFFEIERKHTASLVNAKLESERAHTRKLLREEIEEEAETIQSNNTTHYVYLQSQLDKLIDSTKNFEINSSATRRTVESTGVKVEEIDKRIGKIEEKVQNISEKVDGLDKKVAGLDGKVDGLGEKVQELDQKIASVESSLSQKIHKAQKETIEALSDLTHMGYDLHEKRIKIIETHLDIPHKN